MSITEREEIDQPTPPVVEAEPVEAEGTSRPARWPAWAISAGATTLLFLLRPLVVSGDGVGYIKRLVSPERDVIPGHLIYIPLLEQLRRTLVPEGGHGDAAVIATFFSALGGGVACGLLAWLAARLSGRWWAGLVAAVGLGVSYGFYRASGDVEAYSTSVAVLLGAAVVLLTGEGDSARSWRHMIAAGLLLGLATLLHTSLVLFTPFVFFAAWAAGRSWVRGAVAVAVGGCVSLVSFMAVAMGALGHDVGGAISWILTADNGYAQAPALTGAYLARNFGRLLYGVGRTFVHSPAPDRLGVETSVHLSTLGIAYLIVFLVVLVLTVRRCAPELRRRLRSLWAWGLPLLVFGFVFFPAATERWVFVIPILWTLVAVGLARIERRWLRALAVGVLVGVPLVANIATIRHERRLDHRTLERSAAISRLLREGDLLLYPGHTWDEYVGFYEDAPVERFILASFAGEEQGDRERFLARLRRSLDATLDRGGRVIAIRVLDPPDSHHGWSLLRALGIPRDDVLALLVEYDAVQRLTEPVAVWELRRPPRPSRAVARRSP